MFFLKTKERKVKRQWWFPNEEIIFISCHNAVLGRVFPKWKHDAIVQNVHCSMTSAPVSSPPLALNASSAVAAAKHLAQCLTSFCPCSLRRGQKAGHTLTMSLWMNELKLLVTWMKNIWREWIPAVAPSHKILSCWSLLKIWQISLSCLASWYPEEPILQQRLAQGYL